MKNAAFSGANRARLNRESLDDGSDEGGHERCSALRKDGLPCRARPMTDDPLGRCVVHSGGHARGPMWLHGAFEIGDARARRERRKARRQVALAPSVLRRLAQVDSL